MKRALSDKRRCARIASLFKTLSHPQRLFLLCCLCDGESTVHELQAACGAPQPVISQHLTRMRLEGIVASRRRGNYVHYHIADPQIPALIRSMEKILHG